MPFFLHISSNFYSRASYEARQVEATPAQADAHFYSRASYEARRTIEITHPIDNDFYSRASYEARRYRLTLDSMGFHFYSRASYEARPFLSGRTYSMPVYFYSRASYEARLFMFCEEILCNISTHAPHTRRDASRAKTKRASIAFLLTRLIRGATLSQCLL